jgi:hypothetical protein
MKQPGFDPRRLALLSGSGLAPNALPAVAGNSPDTMAASDSAHPAAASVPVAGIHLDSKGYNRSQWTVTAPTAGILVLSELWFPHWSVKVDGKPAGLLRINFAFRGVKLEAGVHQVAFAYHSPWIAIGLKICFLSAVVLLLLLFGLRKAAPRLERLAANRP